MNHGLGIGCLVMVVGILVFIISTTLKKRKDKELRYALGLVAIFLEIFGAIIILLSLTG